MRGGAVVAILDNMTRAALLLLLVVVVGAIAARGFRRPPLVASNPYCRRGNPLTGIYHPDRLHVRSRCRIATGTVQAIKFEDFDGDIHIDLRLDDTDRGLLSDGNARTGGNLVVEVIPRDRLRVVVPEVGAHVTVAGPWVDDTTHDWREIHPAWWVSAGTILPPTPRELSRATILLNGGGGGGDPG